MISNQLPSVSYIAWSWGWTLFSLSFRQYLILIKIILHVNMFWKRYSIKSKYSQSVSINALTCNWITSWSTSGSRIWTCDLKVMSLASYQTALSRKQLYYLPDPLLIFYNKIKDFSSVVNISNFSKIKTFSEQKLKINALSCIQRVSNIAKTY